LNIRLAQVADAEQLSQIAEETFRATYLSTNTTKDLNIHCKENFSKDLQSAELSNPSIITLVGEIKPNMVAYSQLHLGEPPSCIVAKFPSEIRRFYISEAWHGKGLAQQLMKASIKQLEDRGADCIWLGVWENNPRAISFYRKFGFAEVGEHRFLLGRDLQKDIIMSLPVGMS
jgi:ribosomal protein S18 acetylase RimI-like enzyme